MVHAQEARVIVKATCCVLGGVPDEPCLMLERSF